MGERAAAAEAAAARCDGHEDDGSCDNSGDGKLWFRRRLLALNHIRPLAFKGWELLLLGRPASPHGEWSGRTVRACRSVRVFS